MTIEREPGSGLLVIRNDADIPEFATDEDERDFWASHTESEDRLEALAPPPPDFLPPPRRQQRDVISLDSRMSRRLAAVAEAQHTTPAALARRFLRERLAEEERRTGS
jgi:hypothetical protein